MALLTALLWLQILKMADTQNKSFEEIAAELGCDESDDALDKAFDNLDVKVEKEEESTEDEQDQ